MKRLFLLLASLLVVLVIAYGFVLLLNRSQVERIQTIAHRGAMLVEPENTLAAFRRAAEDDIDWLEFDVQMTSDGELVVMHDLTVDRTTDGTGLVADFSFDEIRALDAGEGEQVPTLAEVVALAKELEVGIMPEIKGPDIYEDIEEKVVAELERADYLEQTIVQSFDPDSLAVVNGLQPDLSLCLLTRSNFWGLPASLHESPYDLCPMAEIALLNPLMIWRAHANGRHVYVWFGLLENPLTFRLMGAHGADGIIADDHLMLLEAL